MHHHYHVTFHFLFPLLFPSYFSSLDARLPLISIFSLFFLRPWGAGNSRHSWHAIRSWNATISSSKDGYLERKNVCTADWVYVLSSLVYLLVCSGSTALSVGWWCKIFSPEQIIIHLTNAPLSSEYSHNVATGRQPCRFEAAWRQLLDTLVELLHCL